MHLWLDPANAKAMARSIEAALIKADAGNAATYQENARKLQTDIDALDAELAETVKPIKDKPFIVFHDAYQYFEHRYGVKTAGSITVSPETLPGADRVKQMQEKVRQLGATCVFAEPQFEPKTWKAFQGFLLEDRPAADVAAGLGMTVNAVFIAKSRVMARLRQEAEGLID